MTKDYGRGSDMTGAMCKERTSPARSASGGMLRCEAWFRCKWGKSHPRCKHSKPHSRMRDCLEGCRGDAAVGVHICRPIDAQGMVTATGEDDG